MPSLEQDVRLYVVIVLYKMQPLASPTLRTLLQSIAACTTHHPTYRVLLYDNMPPAEPSAGLIEQHVEYYPSSVNVGLADAYNLSVQRARSAGFNWLLTLDQDTELPVDFIPKMLKVAREVRPEIAAIVPYVRAGDRDVSPYWFAGGIIPRFFPKDYEGVPQQAVYAFNSGTLVRVSAVEAIKGYSRLFWLDYCDGYLYRKLENQGFRVYVAGNVHLQHDFSLLDIANKMSLWRYQNAVHAGSAFYDLEMGRLAGLEHTFRLLGRYFNHLLRRDSLQVRRITGQMLWQRLFTRKDQRIGAWTESQQKRIADLDGGCA